MTDSRYDPSLGMNRDASGYRSAAAVIGVPYHLHEYLPDLDLPLEPDQVITAELAIGAAQ